jgi:hypothetical protein
VVGEKVQHLGGCLGVCVEVGKEFCGSLCSSGWRGLGRRGAFPPPPQLSPGVGPRTV